jgi:hypothetical protein
MQTNNLMANQILARPESLRHPLTPKTRTPIPPRKLLLEPAPRLDGAPQQAPLPNLEPVRVRGVEFRAGPVAGSHPCDHGADRVHPGLVDGGYVLPCVDRDGAQGRRAGRVAGEGGVCGGEDGVVGCPFSLDDVRVVGLGCVVAEGVISVWCGC